MTVFCPKCGTQNPATFEFCSKCGTALAEARDAVLTGSGVAGGGEPATPEAVDASPQAVPIPPTATPPPATPPQPATPPPTATGASAAPPVKPPPSTGRFPLPFILGGMIAAILLAGAIGVVLGGSGRPPEDESPPLPTPAPVVSAAPSAAATSPQPGASTPSPRPGASTPSPRPTVSTPSPGTGGGTGGQATRYETDTFAVTMPAAFRPGSVQGAGNSQFISDMGTFSIGSGELRAPVTPQVALAGEIAALQKVDPDAQICKGPAALALQNGPRNAWSVIMCVTLTSQSGQKLQVFWFTNIGTASDDRYAFRVNFIAPKATFTALFDTVFDEIMPTVQFKLLPPEEMTPS